MALRRALARPSDRQPFDSAGVAGRVDAQRLALILGLGVFLALFSDTAMYIVLPVNMERAGITLAQVGLMLAANRLVRIPLNGPGGLLVERMPRRPVLLAAQLIGVIASLAYLVTGFWPLLIGRMLWGISWIGLWIAGNAALLDAAPPESRGNLSGRFHLWIFAGFFGRLTRRRPAQRLVQLRGHLPGLRRAGPAGLAAVVVEVARNGPFAPPRADAAAGPRRLRRRAASALAAAHHGHVADGAQLDGVSGFHQHHPDVVASGKGRRIADAGVHPAAADHAERPGLRRQTRGSAWWPRR